MFMTILRLHMNMYLCLIITIDRACSALLITIDNVNTVCSLVNNHYVKTLLSLLLKHDNCGDLHVPKNVYICRVSLSNSNGQHVKMDILID